MCFELYFRHIESEWGEAGGLHPYFFDNDYFHMQNMLFLVVVVNEKNVNLKVKS